jgi:hypothetical protein
MDINKLTTADRVVGISAIVFLIAFFLPWYGVDDVGSDSGASYLLTGWIPLLLAAGMVTVIVLTRFTTTALPKLPLPWGQVFLIAGAVIAVLVLLRTIIPSDVEIPFSDDFTLDRMFGLFIALLAAIGLAVGGFLKSKEPEPVTSGGGAPGYPGGAAPPPPPPGGTSF